MDASKLAQHCDEIFDLQNAKLAEEYFYQSLPLCVIDAVFSIGVRYSSTQNVVRRYCDYFNLLRTRTEPNLLPAINTQEPISSLVKQIDDMGVKYFTDKIFCNKQRTSPKNGILKTEAVYKFAKVLCMSNVQTFQDVHRISNSVKFEESIKLIPGQNSGISLKYFFMLAGADSLIKPDRMIHRFLENFFRQTQQRYEPSCAITLLQETSAILSRKYPSMTPRLLDNQIWNYQSKNI